MSKQCAVLSLSTFHKEELFSVELIDEGRSNRMGLEKWLLDLRLIGYM